MSSERAANRERKTLACSTIDKSREAAQALAILVPCHPVVHAATPIQGVTIVMTAI